MSPMKNLTLKLLRHGVQLHWFSGQWEKSLTLFVTPSSVSQMRRASRFCNDVKWFGPVRFAATN